MNFLKLIMVVVNIDKSNRKQLDEVYSKTTLITNTTVKIIAAENNDENNSAYCWWH